MSIIINYTHHDAAFAIKLDAQLSRRYKGLNFEPVDLSTGDAIFEKIKKADEGASVLLLVMSTSFISSIKGCKLRYAKLLLELARAHIVVIPVIFDDFIVPEIKPGVVVADFRRSFNDGLEVVDGVLRAVVERMAATEALNAFLAELGD